MRGMSSCRSSAGACRRAMVGLAIASLMVCATKAAPVPTRCRVLDVQGALYLSLDDVVAASAEDAEITATAREVRLTLGGRRWEFANGGDQVVGPDGQSRPLRRPLLVIAGRYWLPLHEGADVLGYAVDADAPREMRLGDKRVELKVQPLPRRAAAWNIDRLAAVHEFLETTAEVPACGPLLEGAVGRGQRLQPNARLPEGHTVLVRRTFLLNGVPYCLVTDTGSEPNSLVVSVEALRARTRAAGGARTAWSEYRAWFGEQAAAGHALRRGSAERLEQSIAVTIDLCWSLRAYEESLFQSLAEVARRQQRALYPVVFVSGRWLEQHPHEMDALLALDREPNVHIIWGLHSWIHPKEGAFLNGLSPEEVRRDTLRLERGLLEWGIVPTVYYRFPGLIHDATRLNAILELDLLPIDCSTWMAWVRPQRPEPFYHPVESGSIVLLHGNGNEPRGIDAFRRWLSEHGDWRWAPLHEFLPRQPRP